MLKNLNNGRTGEKKNIDTIDTWKRWKMCASEHTLARHSNQSRSLLFLYHTVATTSTPAHFFNTSSIYLVCVFFVCSVAVVGAATSLFFSVCASLVRVISFASHFYTWHNVDWFMHFILGCYFIFFVLSVVFVNRSRAIETYQSLLGKSFDRLSVSIEAHQNKGIIFVTLYANDILSYYFNAICTDFLCHLCWMATTMRTGTNVLKGGR